MELKGVIVNKNVINQGVLVNKTLALQGVIGIKGEPVYVGGEVYEGPYTVKPKAFTEQILNTEAKAMTNNVKVLEIPYYEVSNVSGITVIIGD